MSPGVEMLVGGDSELPVLEKLPLVTEASCGFDTLLTTVQIPTDVPAAIVVINETANAVLLTAQLPELSVPELGENS